MALGKRRDYRVGEDSHDVVDGAICVVNFDDEQNSSLLNGLLIAFVSVNFLEEHVAFSHTRLSSRLRSPHL